MSIPKQIRLRRILLPAVTARQLSAGLWNSTFSLKEDADKHSCEIIRGKERFSIIQFPMNHVTQILGNNAGSPLTQNDIEGINEQFYLVDSIDDLDVSVLESHTVICWSSDTCYYVVLNSTWTNFDDMKNILQGIRP